MDDEHQKIMTKMKKTEKQHSNNVGKVPTKQSEVKMFNSERISNREGHESHNSPRATTRQNPTKEHTKDSTPHKNGSPISFTKGVQPKDVSRQQTTPQKSKSIRDDNTSTSKIKTEGNEPTKISQRQQGDTSDQSIYVSKTKPIDRTTSNRIKNSEAVDSTASRQKTMKLTTDKKENNQTDPTRQKLDDQKPDVQQVTFKDHPVATYDEIENNIDIKNKVLQYFSDFKSRKGEEKKHLPKAIIIGCSKCGSRALLDFLDIHPDIETAGSEKDFFNRHYNLGLSWYENSMPLTFESQLAVEKSPDYFEHRLVPERIYQMNRTIKLIVVVCEPIKRAISDYVQDVSYRKPEDVRPFEYYVVLPNGIFNAPYYTIQRGQYSVYMERWLKVFPLEQIHVLDGKLLKENPYQVMLDCEKFLGLRRFFYKELFPYDKKTGFFCYMKHGIERVCITQAKGRVHPKVDPKVIDLLRNHFKSYNEKFFTMINKRFNWTFVPKNK